MLGTAEDVWVGLLGIVGLNVSLGEGLGGGDWSLRLYYKPYVRWIWLGGLLIALGGLLAALDRRYRIGVRRHATRAAPAARKTLASDAGA